MPFSFGFYGREIKNLIFVSMCPMCVGAKANVVQLCLLVCWLAPLLLLLKRWLSSLVGLIMVARSQ
jgi:hypothetical protein